MQDKEAGISRAWELLSSAKDPSILALALHDLAANRQLLSVNVERAGLLLQALQSCSDNQDPLLLDRTLRHGLPLLARWAMQHRRPRAQHPQESTLLQRAVAWLLNLLQSPACCNPPATVISAAVLFLGAAYPGCVQELQAASASVTCALISPGPLVQPILELRDAEDVCAGVRLILEHAMQEDDPSRCEWLLACLISSLQHASEAGMQGMTGGRAAVSEPWGPNTATATLSTRADISSSTGSRGAQQGSSRDAAHDGGVLWPPGTPSLWSSCNDHRTARQAAFLAAALRQLGAAAVQTLGSSLLLSPGGRAGAGSLGTAHTQQQGSWASPRPQVQAASAQQHGVQGGAQRGASSVRGGLARPACLVRSLEAMAGLLERGSACLGENGSAYRGNGGAAGPTTDATAAVSLMAAAGLLEGLEVQLQQLHSTTQAHIHNQLQLTIRRLNKPLQEALSAAACARLMHPHTFDSLFPPQSSNHSCLSNQPPADQGHTCCTSCQQASCAHTGAHTSGIHLRGCCSGQLASLVWPELIGPQGLADGCAVRAHAVHAAPPLPSPLLVAMVQQGRELLPWATGIIAGRLLALPQLMHALLPSSHHPHLAQEVFQQHAASTPAPAAAAVTHLRELLLRSLLPALAARALLECSLGLDTLALFVLEAAPPDAANSWLQGLAAGDDPLFRDAPALARCVVNAIAHPPLSQSPPSSSPLHIPPATSTNALHGTQPQPAATQSTGIGVARGGDGDQARGEALRVCQQVGLESLLDALQRGGARASARYSAVALHAPPCWLSSLNGAALRDLMDRLFVSAVAPLPALLSTWPEFDAQMDSLHGSNVTHSPLHAQLHDDHHQQQQQQQYLQQQNQHSRLAQAVGEGSCRSRASARMLLLLGHLQFCRVQLPTLAGLIRRLVWEVVQQPAGCAAVLHGMPSYQELLQPVFGVGTPLGSITSVGISSGGGNSSSSSSSSRGATPVWMADAVLGARMLFLLPIAAACVGRVCSPHAAAVQLLPSLYLLLKHPQPPVFEAAHAAFGSIVQQLGEYGAATKNPAHHQQQQQHQPQNHQHHLLKWFQGICARGNFGAGAKHSGSISAAHAQGVDAPACMAVAQQALPYYVQRSLLPPWGSGHTAAFERTLPGVLSVMPPASPITLYCLVYVLEAASSWIQAHPHHPLDFSPLYAGHSPQQQQQQQQQPPELHPGTRLASLACNLVLLADWQLLPQVLDGVSRLICRASPFPPPFPPEAPAPTMEPAPENAQTPPPSAAPDPSAAAPLAVPKGAERAPTAQQTALLQYLHDQLLRSNDYARKELLAQWLLGLAGDLRADAGRHGGAGRGSRLGTDRMARSPGTTPADAGRHGGAGRGSRLGTDCMARSPGTTPAPTDQAGDLLAEHAS